MPSGLSKSRVESCVLRGAESCTEPPRGGGPPGVRAYMKAEFLPELSDEAIAIAARHGASRPGPLVQLLLEPMGGAIGRVDPSDTALGRRDAPWCFHALSMWMDPSEEAEEMHIGWTRALAEEIAPHTTTGSGRGQTAEQSSPARGFVSALAEVYAELGACAPRGGALAGEPGGSTQDTAKETYDVGPHTSAAAAELAL
jgi:hypothetical protein